jgi:hypothetical protein
MGKNFFQVKFIKLSYRNRGNVPRIHNTEYNKIILFKINKLLKISPPKKIFNINIIKIIIPYSAIKIIANLPLIYSVLNPETNSDSPSAKSKGVRFNSAKILT